MDETKTAAPPGTYAGGKRSPLVHVFLCPPCGGYKPFTPEDYSGALSGQCSGCGSLSRELHRFPAFVHSASPCACQTMHGRVTGDLSAAPTTDIREAAAGLVAQMDASAFAEQPPPGAPALRNVVAWCREAQEVLRKVITDG